MSDRVEAARALALAAIVEWEVRLMATRMQPRGRRLEAVAAVAAEIDAVVAAAEHVFGERATWAPLDTRARGRHA